jgi:PAS domain S-box-containing protein
MKTRLLIVSLVFYCSVLFPQPKILDIQNYNTTHGLSSSDVLSIIQDKYGYIWIGTDHGLNRFDGCSFRVYKNAYLDSTSLAGDFVMKLYVDKVGNLWVGTRYGLSKYNPQTDDFTNFPMGKKYRDIVFVREIMEDTTGNLLVATDAGNIFKYDPQTQTFQLYKHLVDGIVCLIIDKQNNFWIGSSSGFYFYDDKVSKLTRYETPLFPTNNIIALFKYQDEIWLGTNANGLLSFNTLSNKFSQLNSEAKFFTYFYEDHRHKIWIANEKNIIIYDPQKRLFTENYEVPAGEIKLLYAGVACIFEDNQGTFWIGIEYGGVNTLTFRKPFYHYTTDSTSTIKLSRKNVTSIFEDSKKNLWVGFFESGVDVIKRDRNTKKYFGPGNSDDSRFLDGSMFCTFEDNQKNIWLGCYFKGLIRYEPKTNRFINYEDIIDNNKILKVRDVRSIVEDRNGNLWGVMQGNGIFQFNPQTKEFISYNYAKNDLVIDWTNKVFFDSDGILWIATTDGLSKFDGKDHFKNFRNITNDSTSINNNFVTTIFEDSKKRLWIGTTEGLHLFNKQTEKFKFYGKKNGLKCDYICGILEDNHGNLWLSTKEGLTKFNPQLNYFKDVEVRKGSQINEFFINSCFKTRAGELFFGGVNGLISFFPDSIAENTIIPPVVLTDFKIFNKSIINNKKQAGVISKPIPILDEVRLPYSQNVITFTYAALNYIQPERNQYAYKMEGFDLSSAGWNYVGNQREATYTNLEPGTYTFRVIASNNDGYWNKEGLSIRVIIVPPLWRQWWFRMSIAGSILFIAFVIHKLRLRAITRRAKELEQRVQERTTALNQSNLDLQQEIIHRKKIEEDIAAEREQLEITLRSIGDGVITTDISGKIILMNPIAEKLTGWSQDEAIGAPLRDIFHVVDETTRESILNQVERLMLTRSKVDIANNILLIAKDGSEHVITESGALIRDRISKVIGMVLVFRDVTERIKIDQELQKTHKLESLGILAGGIAHDFNNILTAILSNVSLALLNDTPKQELHELLSGVQQASIQAKDLTQQLLTFSKGGVPIKELIVLTSILKEATTFALRGSNVKCQFFLTDDLWTTEVDAAQMNQVFNNLVINASQAMPEGGIVEVFAENVIIEGACKYPIKIGHYVKITIRDQGIGIPTKYLTKIFDPFFTTKQKGNGLGLSITYSIIKKHDGYIFVESEIELGTSFYIFLPASFKKFIAKQQTELALSKSTGKILVMDDQEYIRSGTRHLLNRMGYNVEVTCDGDETISLYRKALTDKAKFDLIIMDLTIPGGMGGREAIAKLLEIDPSVKAVVSSGYSNDPVIAHFKNYGFCGVLIKPYTYNDVKNVLKNLLN